MEVPGCLAPNHANTGCAPHVQRRSRATLAQGLVSAEDMDLIKVTDDPEEAAELAVSARPDAKPRLYKADAQ